MKISSCIITLLLGISTVVAQDNKVHDAMVFNSLQRVDGTPNKNQSTMAAYDTRYEGIKGSRYFIDEWLTGQLVFVKENTKAPKNVPLKYDSHSKELLFKRALGDSIIVNPNQITGFIINDAAHNISYPFVKVDGLKTEGGV